MAWKKLSKGVYRDSHGIRAIVDIAAGRKEKRFPPDAELADVKHWRNVTKVKLEKLHPDRRAGARKRRTLNADGPRYLTLHTHLVSYTNRRAIVQHWQARLGTKDRARISPQDVLAARVAWLKAGHAPKTINHRVDVLRHLYTVLDGKDAYNPADDIAPLPVPRSPIQRISDATILRVDRELARRERDGTNGRRLDGAKTRARFRVLVSTGRRPSEIMRAEASDVDMENRVWVVRDGKGGWSPGVYLNDDMLAAWTLFLAADAWGAYSTSAFANTIRAAGWPKSVRPYHARHTTWITAVERGADMADVQIGAGHKSLTTTRQHYTGVRHSRMQQLSERLDGRFDGFTERQESLPRNEGDVGGEPMVSAGKRAMRVPRR